MSQLFQLCLVLLLLNNLAMLGCNHIPGLVKLTVVQGVLIALLLVATAGGEPGMLFLALAILAIKGVCLPRLLFHTMKKVAPDPALRPYLGHSLSVVAGIVGLVLSFWLEGRLPVVPGLFPPLLIPTALTTLFCGLLLVVGRSRAVAQVIGYLVAENGIFLLGIPLMAEGAVWFELTLLLDVFVAVFVMGIAINHISDTFETINSDRFCNLHD